MVEPVSVSTSIPIARPPTPPRESGRADAPTGFLGRLFFRESSSHQSSSSALHLTPPESSLEVPNTSSGSIRKRVGWADSADYSEPPAILSDGEGLFRPVQPLPPSAERKPPKSILKAYNASQDQEYNIGNNRKLLPPHHHATFTTMLESIVQQLTGNDRTSKIDAYLMLSSSLKASDNVPSIRALKQKISLLCQCIIHDVTSKGDNGKPDSALIVNSIMLLASFLHKSAIAECLPPDFQINVVEFTIRALGDGSTSKEVIRHLIFVLAQQNFSPKVMNQDRVVRLINALHNVEKQVKGKSIITGRHQAYRNLLRRSRLHMLSNTAWMEDLFIDMRSTSKDVRNSAITFGLEASFQLGTESSASRAMSDIFKVEHSEGTSFAEFYATNLKAMIRKKDEGTAVPQIWSVIMLFLRSKPQLFEQWSYMKVFLDVLSMCWNASDLAVRNETNHAWNRFIFAAQLSEKTALGTRTMLFQPLSSQIKQRKSQAARKSALNSIYHLLYYAFNPTSSHACLDTYWDGYVVPLMVKVLITDDSKSISELAKPDINEACTILCSLFDTATQRPWSENRAIGSSQQSAMNAKELPGLDAKWTRNRSARIWPLLNSLLEKLYWDLGEDESPVTQLWQTYIKTIALPAKMEVKVSIDTMNCIASLFGALYRLWAAGRVKISSVAQSKGRAPYTTAAFLTSFEKLITTTIEGLGPLAFTEKLLAISQDTFTAIATPSQMPKKRRAEFKSPLHHLLLLMMTISPGLEYDQRFSSMVHRILSPFFEARTSSRSRKEFVKELFNLLPLERTEPCTLIWQVLADFASQAIDLRDKNDNNGQMDMPLGFDYRETIKILEAGIRYSPINPLTGWKILFEALATSAALDAGDSGKAIAVIEPLSKILVSKDDTPPSLHYLHILLTKASYPKDRQALDIASKRMWGASTSTQKVASFDPYNCLYEYAKLSLESTYISFSKLSLVTYVDVIADISTLLSRCPKMLLLGVLKSTQEGIIAWITDNDSRLSGGNDLSQAILSLWSVIGSSITQILQSRKHSKVLSDLAPLLCAGLESKHKTIVNSTVRTWNASFGSCRDHLEYPESIKSALVRLHHVADIILPFFPDSLEPELSVNQAQRIEFADTQDDASIYPSVLSIEFASKPSLDEGVSPMTRRLRQPRPQVILAALRSSPSKKRSRESTPDERGRKLRKRETTPQARHDDSQIEFEAVPSSPIIGRVIDSQLLTEKQKETRERQHTESALFLDLGSSLQVRENSSAAKALQDLELPLHRPASRTRGKASPEVLRQTTPTLMMPSDDDQFVASSPTPTRSIRDNVEKSDPPSSPPQSPMKKRSILVEDIPSSPSESSLDSEHDIAMSFDQTTHEIEERVADLDEPTTFSPVFESFDDEGDMQIDPSAQINPYPLVEDLPFSTWESTVEEPSSSPCDGPSDQLRADASQHSALESDLGVEGLQHPLSSAEDFAVQKISDASLIIDATDIPVLHETHVREQQSSPPGNSSPQFVDAPTSPSFSDINPINEDIFEDAISSPQLQIGELGDKAPSSPLSDIDERSMLRIMAEFDRGSAQTSKNVTFLEKNNPELLPAPGPVTCSPATATLPARKYALRSTPNREKQQQNGDKEEGGIKHQLQTSSIPSLIPETPGPRPRRTRASYMNHDGERVHTSDSIIVDVSRLENEQPPTANSRVGRPSKKRKFQEAVDDVTEVPDSQDAAQESKASVSPKKTSPKKTGSPAKKRSRGRPKRASQISLENEGGFEMESSQDLCQIEPGTLASPEVQPDQSLIPMDIEFAEAIGQDSVADQTASVIPQPPMAANAEAMDVSSEAAILDIQHADISRAENETQKSNKGSESPQAYQESSIPAIDIGEETIINDSMAEMSSSALAKPEDNPHQEVMFDTPPQTEIPGSQSAPEDQHREESVQVEPSVAARLIEGVKNRLRSIIGDLGLLGLGRRDALELEDLFMDGKRALYQAESRGRESTGS